MQNKINLGSGCAFLVENGVFVLGMVLMFSKTVDLMSIFAPAQFMGYEDVAAWYGFAVGVMIEGALVVMKFTIGTPKNLIEWLWTILLLIVTFSISAFAQVFDSFIIMDTLQEQPEEIQAILSWFVPSIPTLIVALFIGKSIFRSIPSELAGDQVMLAGQELKDKIEIPKIEFSKIFKKGKVKSKDENFTKRK